MINANTIYNVLNRSSSMVGYTIPELNIRREFQPGETKKIKFSELEQLTYQPGGTTLIQDYFLIREQEVTDALNIQTEIEYYMNEDNVKDLILKGSLDQFLDCLDFAPEGVLEMIKKLAIELPMNDVEKREALKRRPALMQMPLLRIKWRKRSMKVRQLHRRLLIDVFRNLLMKRLSVVLKRPSIQ